ncbi:hypothetical protein SAMN05421852_1133 [Thermoflavimicrobium dichotomicum]|uniref:Uncharacterized protein n=1 Tax=Thermoflavimicrobium dichotomicum TaxID=46223 RepID=A0A1I3SEB3_9BACL|nr:hypothetical protein SAMN05421852_1133 [Thermoflavimicrobium dichotomicum]
MVFAPPLYLYRCEQENPLASERVSDERQFNTASQVRPFLMRF